MGVGRDVEVQLKHLIDVETQWSRNQRTYRYKVWSVPASRPDADGDPGEGVLTCGDCGAVVPYRLWTVARTQRRQRILNGVALGCLAVFVVALVLFLGDPFGSRFGYLVPTLAGSLTALGFALAAGVEKGIRGGRAAWADGRRAPRHPVELKDLDGLDDLR